jgi:hypothetical protein
MVRIVSGGQSGVDRAALDAALALGVNAGGWCPEGRLAEDGVIPDIYPLKELPMAGYRQRTKKNVIDSDGTLIIYFGFPTGGTELDIRGSILRRERPKSRLKGKPLFRYDYWAPIAQSGSPKERPRDKSADPGRNCPLLCSGRVPLHFILNCSPYLILQAASDQVRVNGRFHTPHCCQF